MKKIFIFGLLMVFFSSFSQSITVNTTKYTADELVNQVLINSPCVNAININVKSGSQFGSTNSIGYFENTNSNFPFSSGVVLSTGDVTKSPAPNDNILSDGNSSWTGDTDLENNLLSQSGITINSVNATYIEFDFQPKTPNFDFSFLFASEEYGTSQCNFSDAFAFLLKDVTASGINRNIAVIPGTNIPVSVETIRDDTYNSDCPSANPSYFGAYNPSGFGPAINFNGQTVEMVASASGLDTTHTYRIKLVIADGGDNVAYDSAIFLEANSFNIGQDVLGMDYTTANNRAICPSTVLPTLNATGLPAGTTFIWKKEGVPFSPAQTASTLNLNSLLPLISSGIHNYSVSYIEPGCTEVTDEIKVEIYPEIGVMTTVPPIYLCNTGLLTYDFDLTKNTIKILAGKNQSTSASGVLDDLTSGTLITYHLSDTDAIANNNAITSPHSISNAENGKTIYARIQNPTTNCFEIRSFQLQIVNSPIIATTPSNITLCALSASENPPKADFDLNTSIASILGSQDTTYNILTFHTTLAGANNNTAILAIKTNNFLLSSSRTIWARIQNISNPDCYITTSFDLIVTPLPEVDILPDVFVCTAYSLPILTKTGAQYWTGANGTGTELFAGNSINTNTTLYVYNQSGGCTNQESFKITITDLNTVTPKSESYCTQYKLPSLPYGKYFTQSGGTKTSGNTELPAGITIKTAGINTIYVWFEDTTVTPSCTEERIFTITIIPFTALPDYPDQFACSSYTLPSDPNGATYYSGTNKGMPILAPGTVITNTTSVFAYKESGTAPLNCSSEKSFTVYVDLSNITPPADVNSCSAYTLPNLNFGQYRTAVAGGGIEVPAATVINTTTTLWFYVPGQNCTDNLQFTITVNIPPLPTFNDTPPHCDVYYLPSVAHSGDYFTGPLGSGSKRDVGYPVTATQTIYFYDKAAVGACYVEDNFLITINRSPTIDARPIEVIKCGANFVLDDLRNGEYYEFAGGPSSTNPILPPGSVITTSKKIYAYAAATAPNNCTKEYAIDIFITKVNLIDDQYACDSYILPAIVGQGDYYTATGGPNGSGVKLSQPYAPITNTTTLYVYAEDNSRVSCFDEDEFTVTIYNTPIVSSYPPVTRCESYALPPFVAPVNKYFTQPGVPSATNTEKFPGDLITSSTTIYAYAETGTATTKICFDEQPMEITILSKPNPVINTTPICHDFANGNTSNSYSISNYTTPQYAFEWRAADGTLLSSAKDFSTNQAGNYTLTVTDLSIFSCSSDSVDFTVEEIFPPISITYTTEDWFSDRQTVIINAIPISGDGSNFLYSIDGNSPQTSNTFTNVQSGTHEISISDANGCGSTIPIVIQLINSPKYFTPNGDGFNDTWNVTALPNQENPNIYIFDRYGKLLKQLTPNGTGWDGTFNGKPLPATDYWFSIEYTEGGVLKQYRSHFSLKR
ncbi:choice-of-anchor L domain-containing protein [Flavobacterium sp. Arc2]|uniref:T9SS type B sorting domain-containing protein n=1 Tax=Flavobacterium sp. Arc2 TaxID=3046685 RepID=UPI00352F9821